MSDVGVGEGEARIERIGAIVLEVEFAAEDAGAGLGETLVLAEKTGLERVVAARVRESAGIRPARYPRR